MVEEKKIFGYNGKILHVNMSTEKFEIEEPNTAFYRTYLGGGLMGTYYVYKKTPPNADPLSPENTLVFAPSITTGIAVAGVSRFNISAKSPLTGAIGDTQCGGAWGPKLKHAGFDAIVITGKASSPKYLLIDNGKPEIRDASKIWGKTTGESQVIIREELDDKRVEIAQIGQGGENLVKYACITGGLTHFAGRTGMGAVMGSKNLKAIAVRGSKTYAFFDNEETKEMNKLGVTLFKESIGYQNFHKNGTPANIDSNAEKGMIATRNFKSGNFDKINDIEIDKYNEKILKGTHTCWGCPVGCKRTVEVKGTYVVDPKYGGPEFESIVMLGPNLDIGNLEFIAKANEVCNKYGIDTISTGAVISYTMECYEKGIIDKEALSGLELNFGNEKAVLELIEMIAFRKGVGDLMADGFKTLIEKWGPETEKFAMHTKLNPFPAHMPRVKKDQGLIYAVNPFGADHMSSEHGWIATQDGELSRGLAITDFTDIKSLDNAKIRAAMNSQYFYSLMDTLTLCDFVWGPGCLIPYNYIEKLIHAITGWKTNLFELMKAGERRINLMRMFNAREGLTFENDKLPERCYEALDGGVSDGFKFDKENFNKALKSYYKMMNWNPETGVPTEGKLMELGLSWII